jgi:hypothetical protein
VNPRTSNLDSGILGFEDEEFRMSDYRSCLINPNWLGKHIPATRASDSE